jgi:hypothetical protein
MTPIVTTESHLSLIAKTIQLSVAPVFLLTAIGTMLAVLVGRLNRIVDRARILEEHLASVSKDEEGPKSIQNYLCYPGVLHRSTEQSHWVLYVHF